MDFIKFFIFILNGQIKHFNFYIYFTSSMLRSIATVTPRWLDTQKKAKQKSRSVRTNLVWTHIFFYILHIEHFKSSLISNYKVVAHTTLIPTRLCSPSQQKDFFIAPIYKKKKLLKSSSLTISYHSVPTAPIHPQSKEMEQHSRCRVCFMGFYFNTSCSGE